MPTPAPAATPAPAPKPTPAPAATSTEAFLDGFVARVAAAGLADGSAVVVLPLFNVNPLFRRYEVSVLGEELAGKLLIRLGRALGSRVELVSPALFRERLRATNRSLADLDSPQAAAALARRTGARYLVRGLIEAAGGVITVDLVCEDVVELRPVEETRSSFPIGSAPGRALASRFRNEVGHVALGSYRIGALAPAAAPSLQAELQLLFRDAVGELLTRAGDGLEGLPLAVLLTQTPGEIRFQKYQRAILREVDKEKKRLLAQGFSESEAMGWGPVRILGVTYKTLREAESHAGERSLQNRISSSGELRDTLSRIIFDIVEESARSRGIDVIPHDQLVDQAVLFSGEEAEKMREGVLAEKTREYFKTKGAGALLFNELIESGDSYEFIFQIRRMDTLRPLTPQVRRYLEPRFAVQLAGFLKK